MNLFNMILLPILFLIGDNNNIKQENTAQPNLKLIYDGHKIGAIGKPYLTPSQVFAVTYAYKYIFDLKKDYQVYADEKYFYFCPILLTGRLESQKKVLLASRKIEKKEALRIIQLYNESQTFSKFCELIDDEIIKRRKEWEESKRNHS